jgi:hypothetical protein
LILSNGRKLRRNREDRAFIVICATAAINRAAVSIISREDMHLLSIGSGTQAAVTLIGLGFVSSFFGMTIFSMPSL